MTRKIALFAALLASACQVQQAPTDNNAAVANVASEASPSVVAETPVANTGQPGTSAPVPIPGQPGAPKAPPAPPAPPPEEPGPTPTAETSPAAAVAVLRSYCDAIAHKNYGRAYRMWAGDGQATQMSEAAFARSFAKYDAYDCTFSKPGDPEGAAGSSYITVPVVVTGTLARGGGFSLRGPMTLRRVNDVPGLTVEQRHWHIYTSGLKPRP